MELITKNDIIRKYNSNLYIIPCIPAIFSSIWFLFCYILRAGDLDPSWQIDGYIFFNILAIICIPVSVVGLYFMHKKIRGLEYKIKVEVDQVIDKEMRYSSNGSSYILYFENNGLRDVSIPEYMHCQIGDKYYIIRNNKMIVPIIYGCDRHQLDDELQSYMTSPQSQYNEYQ